MLVPATTSTPIRLLRIMSLVLRSKKMVLIDDSAPLLRRHVCVTTQLCVFGRAGAEPVAIKWRGVSGGFVATGEARAGTVLSVTGGCWKSLARGGDHFDGTVSRPKYPRRARTVRRRSRTRTSRGRHSGRSVDS